MSTGLCGPGDAMAAAMRAAGQRRVAAEQSPAFRSTAARIEPGEAYFAIKGDGA